MLELVTAVRFDRKMTSGRTSPCLLECVGNNGDDVELIVKLSSKCSENTKSLMHEAISAMLAKDLNLPVSEPFLVEITNGFIKSIESQEVAEWFSESERIAFGSKKLPSAFMGVIPDSLPESLIQQALEIMAFDSVIQNDDRKQSNLNYLTDGRSLAIFDHELSFISTSEEDFPLPWENNGLDHFKNPYGHAFFGLFKSHKLNVSHFFNSFGQISGKRLQEYRQALPECWCNQGDDIKIIKYLKEAIDKASLIQDRLERILS